jgi:antitoxin VapB
MFMPRKESSTPRKAKIFMDKRPPTAYAWHMPPRRNKTSPERHVKVFKNGRNKVVRIPREFEFPGEDAIMRKEGDRLVIEPVPAKSLLAVLTRLAPLREDFPTIPDAPPDAVEL